jgi:uncharacterized protein (UPF0276 family)
MSLFGVGLRHDHFPFLNNQPQINIDWFEVISENFLSTRGFPFQTLKKIRRDFPVALHGVGMSIGAKTEVSIDYLKKLKKLIYEIDPIIVSDHLCWTGLANQNLHNLLPLPYTQKTRDLLSERIGRIQDFLQRQIALENLSAYFSYEESTETEWDFLKALSLQSGCGILLDLNNVYVNAKNQNFNPYEYIDAIPNEKILQFHLAGHSDLGSFLFDTHSCPALPEVWKLYEHKIKTCPKALTLFEWDEHIPDFPTLENEALKAKKIWNEVHG